MCYVDGYPNCRALELVPMLLEVIGPSVHPMGASEILTLLPDSHVQFTLLLVVVANIYKFRAYLCFFFTASINSLLSALI